MILITIIINYIDILCVPVIRPRSLRVWAWPDTPFCRTLNPRFFGCCCRIVVDVVREVFFFFLVRLTWTEWITIQCYFSTCYSMTVHSIDWSCTRLVSAVTWETTCDWITIMFHRNQSLIIKAIFFFFIYFFKNWILTDFDLKKRIFLLNNLKNLISRPKKLNSDWFWSKKPHFFN